MSVWKPLPDKENPAFSFKPPSNVLAGGPIKISNRSAIPKKQVFVDLKNTIQNFKAGSDERGIEKNAKLSGPVVNADVKIQDDDWPEPEGFPANLNEEDDFEDCLLPGLKFFKLELEGLSDVFGKCSRLPISHMEPDSPICSPTGRINLNTRLEFPDEYLCDIPPICDVEIDSY